ncbi:aconitase family protein [Propionivibrio sp.]|uniref:aconitase family protein n=1 Tax=Propionivibrio sp. TaxID=2212460 RepID=UPI0025F311CC|nr:aconitase family protein [Propionivibrio sp.]
MTFSIFNTLSRLPSTHRPDALFHSLPVLERAGIGNISRMPISLRIVLESLLRNCDGQHVGARHVRELANWQPNAPRVQQIPFMVARVVLQDFTGIPLLCDLAAMRQVARARHLDPRRIEPRVPVDLVVDHSLQVDHYGSALAMQQNMALEFERNHERYQFLKWGQQAFDTFHVIPPGIGIVHQVNLEYLFPGCAARRPLKACWSTRTRWSAPIRTRR